MQLDLNTAVQLGVVIFSAGSAWGAWRLVGAEVKALRERFDDAVKALREDQTEMRHDIATNAGQIDALKVSQAETRRDVSFLQKLLSPYSGTKKQGGS